MKAGADHKLRACVDGGLALIGGGDGAGAEQKLRAVLLFEFLEKINGAGDRHRDFDNSDAARNHSFNYCVSLGRVLCAQHRNQSYAFESFLRGLWHFLLDNRR